MEDKLKHLEFIQNVITRMNTNSFLIKGWAVTLVSALFALAAKDSNGDFAILSYIVIPSFWILDAFFISREKCFRTLYKIVSAKTGGIDFKMSIENYNNGKNTWLNAIFNTTLIVFYGVIVVVTIIIMKIIFK
ncbi:hypothetical protein B0A67_15570 [Flavobacterium aquidurense]|jgi:hypothetical protein|uniref:hypothetical protein n=1 Tax=Flavobacterium aquidurense TaxID=362413 RepID=UPI00091A059D|nr:hypothetical protein [Flavobacterium aquidurense]OXA70643.1 hypothetical protein B0A67_15570 [Flavobacterium aquidurense]SHG29393.1 hypothetical protein SAMN05444481_103266 [Flavobacterium frigidimaris]